MKCVICGDETKVLYTRNGTTRRRECVNGHRFATREIALKELGEIQAMAFRSNLQQMAERLTNQKGAA